MTCAILHYNIIVHEEKKRAELQSEYLPLSRDAFEVFFPGGSGIPVTRRKQINHLKFWRASLSVEKHTSTEQAWVEGKETLTF